MSIKFIKPSISYERSYCAYIEELGEEERYPFVMDFPHQPFAQLIERLADIEAGRSLPSGAVANLTYWLVKERELIGVANLRPKLNDAIAHVGGHIGLGIRPSFRRQGYSQQLLNAVLEQAKIQGMSQLSVHCHANNTASNAMIMRCGGVLESAVDANGERVNRYTIVVA